MLDYIKGRFKTVKDATAWIKDVATTAQDLMRFFTSRKSHYDNLISQVDSFKELMVTTAGVNEINLNEEGDSKRKRKIKDTLAPGVKEMRRTSAGMVLPIHKFKAPSKTTLKKNARLLHDLEGSIDVLYHSLAALKPLKDEEGKSQTHTKFRAQIEKYIEKLEDSRIDLLNVMNDITERHLPPIMEELAGSLANHINDTLDEGIYDAIETEVYTTTNAQKQIKNSPIEFTYYIHILGLDKDLHKDEGFILAVTGLVTEVKGRGKSPKTSYNMSIYLSSMKKFKLPGYFDLGERIAGNDLAQLKRNLHRAANSLLSLNGFSVLGKLKIKLSETQIRNSQITRVDGIVDGGIVEVVEGDIFLEVMPNISDKVINTDIWHDLLPLLNNEIRRKRGYVFKMAIQKRGSKKLLHITRVPG